MRNVNEANIAEQDNPENGLLAPGAAAQNGRFIWSNSTIVILSALSVATNIFNVIKVQNYNDRDPAISNELQLQLSNSENKLLQKASFDAVISSVPALIGMIAIKHIVSSLRNRNREIENSRDSNHVARISALLLPVACNFYNSTVFNSNTKINDQDFPDYVKDSYNELRNDVVFGNMRMQIAFCLVAMCATLYNSINHGRIMQENDNVNLEAEARNHPRMGQENAVVNPVHLAVENPHPIQDQNQNNQIDNANLNIQDNEVLINPLETARGHDGSLRSEEVYIDLKDVEDMRSGENQGSFSDSFRSPETVMANIESVLRVNNAGDEEKGMESIV